MGHVVAATGLPDGTDLRLVGLSGRGWLLGDHLAGCRRVIIGRRVIIVARRRIRRRGRRGADGNPGRNAGANSVSVHYEAARHLDGCLNAIKKAGAMAGVVLNPATPVSVLEEILDVADYVLLMSVNPGFGGQKLIPYVLDKVRKLDGMRQQRKLTLPIEIDGGVHKDNLAQVVRAGCDWIVTGSAIFHSQDAEATVRDMREIAAGATAIQV